MTTDPTIPGEHASALASIPAAGRRRAMPMPAQLTFFHGPMDCGKSTLALQIHHNHARQGRRGKVLTRHDRSGRPQVTTRVGLAHAAVEVHDDTDLRAVVREEWAAGRELDYLVVDEAGFLTRDHVDQLAELVDDWHVDVYCFGLLTDFRSDLLPGAARLVELADVTSPVQVEVLCWCGRPGRLNARLVDGAMVRQGETVVVADTAPTTPTATHEPEVRYQVLCRSHYRHGNLGVVTPADQPQLDFGQPS